MKRIISILFMLIFFGASCYPQQREREPLSCEAELIGMTYKQGDREIGVGEILRILKTSRDSTLYGSFAGGRTTIVIAQLIQIGGGICLGYGLGSKPVDRDFTFVGGAAALAGIVLEIVGKRKLHHVLDRYNEQLHDVAQPSFQPLRDRRVTLLRIGIRL